MAKAFHLGTGLRIGNAVMGTLLRSGVKVGGSVLLTVPGRKSGQPRTTPVTILEWNGQRFLQSPYGEVNWVRNLRAAGRATLTRGGRTEAISVTELAPADAARIYQANFASVPAFIRQYFDVTPESPLEDFEREAARHPMFRVMGDR